MGWFLPLLTIFFGLTATVIVVIVKIKGNKVINKMDVIDNADFIEVGMRKRFTDGYARGLVKKQETCKNGCTRFIFYPTDAEQGENKPIPEVQAVIVKNEFMKHVPKGSLGYPDRRNTIVLIDRFKADIPEMLRDTLIGKEMEKEGQKSFVSSIYGDFIRKGDDALYELIAGQSRVGITKLEIARLREKLNALEKQRENPIDKENK